MGAILSTGRVPYARLVRLYVYDKGFIERDGEPFGFVRVLAHREKGHGYNIGAYFNALQHEMGVANWVGCSSIPDGAARLLPNMYLQVLPAYKKLFNITAIVKMRQSDEYAVYNTVLQYCDMPTRQEIRDCIQNNINTCQPQIAEFWQVQDCINDGWANVGTNVTDRHHTWIHLRMLEEDTFQAPFDRRPLREILDDGEPGDTYLRTRVL